MVPTAQETYALMLLHHGHGYPLWIPEPNNALPSTSFSEGIRLGDVGLITPSGGFDYLFNIFLDENDEVNRWRGVPEGFQPIEFRRSFVCSTDNQHRPKVPICSQHTKQLTLEAEGTVVIPGMPIGIGSGIELQFSHSRGAALMLPEGASRVDYLGLPDIRDYITANTESWYQFVHDTLRLEADNGSLYVITGFDKTHCYETVSFHHSSKNSAVSIRFTSPLLVDGNYGKLGLSYSSDFHMPLSSRASNPANTLSNLSVFVRGFKVMVKKGRSLSSGFKRANGIKVVDVTKGKPDDVVGTRPWSQGSSGYSSSGSSSRPSTGSSMNSTSSNTRSLGIQSDQPMSASYDEPAEDVFAFSVFDTDIIEPAEDVFAFSVFDTDTIEPEPTVPTTEQTATTSRTSYHPSNLINERLLEMFPHSKVAITHDGQWASVLDKADDSFPSDDILFDRIMKSFQATTVNNDVIHLSERTVAAPMRPDHFSSMPNAKHDTSASSPETDSDSSDSDTESEESSFSNDGDTSSPGEQHGPFVDLVNESDKSGKHKLIGRCFHRRRVAWGSWKLL